MQVSLAANIRGAQDGAIWGDHLFRFDADGRCDVYRLSALCSPEEATPPVCTFYLDRADTIVPHSNAATFGPYFYSPEDRFPLLYTNIYNNYANAADPLTGVCCVYRIQQQGEQFTSTLVQLIAIGFTEDAALWRSSAAEEDRRPYGNFVVDRDKAAYYGFVMRDHLNTTRYFSFDLPRPQQGEPDPVFGVNRVDLAPEDIKAQFDCPYHYFLQGACFHGGKVYSVEGFDNSLEAPPALRIIDPARQCQELYVPFSDFGLTVEPECIDFQGDTCWYSDARGALYVIEF